MSEKDPNFLNVVFGLFTPECKAMMMASVIAAMRIVYDRKENKWQRIFLESILCGALSYGISSGLSWFDLPAGVSVFCGAAVGFLGVDFVRSRAIKYVDNKVGEESET